MHAPDPRFKLLNSYRTEIEKCVRCGTCTAFCAIYRETLRESHSARGKMNLLHELLNGGLEVTPALRDRVGKCLQCLRCVENCPQGIPVNDILVAAWAELEAALPGPRAERLLFENIYANPLLMRILGALSTPFQGLLFNRINEYAAGTSKVHIPGYESAVFPLPRLATGLYGLHRARNSRGRVLLYPGCMARNFFPSTVKSAVRVLNHCGFDVEVPAGAPCCGTPFVSLGYDGKARELFRRNLAFFASPAIEAVVTICPTCAFTMRHKYPLLLAGDETVKLEILGKVEELASFLSSRGLFDKFKSLNSAGVTYHDSCHIRRGLNEIAQPREALTKIYGCSFTEAPWSGQCCGFGGVFSFHNPALSQGVRGTLLKAISDANIPDLVTSCPACVFQIGSGLAGEGGAQRIRHLVDVLSEAIGDRR